MVKTAGSRQFMTDGMGRPVRWHAAGQVVVQRLSCAPHQIGPDIVVIIGTKQLGGFLNQGKEDSFGLTILKVCMDIVSQVLLTNMDERIDDTVGQLVLG